MGAVEQFEEDRRGPSGLVVVEEANEGVEVVTEVEGVFDLVADVGRLVVAYEPVECVLDQVLAAPTSLLLHLSPPLRRPPHRLLVQVPLLEGLHKHLRRNQLS